MTSTQSENFNRFKQHYEKLAGKVYFAANSNEAVQCVTQIMSISKLTKAVLAPLLPELEADLINQLRDLNFPILKVQLNRPPIQHQINEADLGISAAEFAIAETGAIVEVTTDDALRLISSLPRVHIAFLKASQILPRLKDAASLLRDIFHSHPQNCTITFISGPSRTADIEMKLFLGVHGPRESHVIVLNR